MKYLILLSLFVVGCGGSGGGQSLAGHWTGTLSNRGGDQPPPGDTGTFNLNISGSGAVTGTYHNVGRDDDANVTGTIKDGIVDLLFDYPSRPDWTSESFEGFSQGPSFLNFTLRINSEEQNRTVHVYGAKVSLTKN